jgi:type IV pilus assembly protein PilV
MNQRYCIHNFPICLYYKGKGFTLIEVLVTLIVMSVGLLSLAGLQVIGLRTNHSAYMRSQATIMSYEIVDRMRANIAGVRAGHYNQPTVAGSAGFLNDTTCETTAGCNAQQMAENDLFRWNQAVADVLPGGFGVVCIDLIPDDGNNADPQCDNTGGANPGLAVYAIKIWWDDDQNPATDPQRYITSLRP